ncbi:hypothetical protein E4U52_006954 [Claviceps spartinae]|nr:hypothetical protein E4U52_006954 [Claviceps spartinae]
MTATTIRQSYPSIKEPPGLLLLITRLIINDVTTANILDLELINVCYDRNNDEAEARDLEDVDDNLILGEQVVLEADFLAPRAASCRIQRIHDQERATSLTLHSVIELVLETHGLLVQRVSGAYTSLTPHLPQVFFASTDTQGANSSCSNAKT